MKFVTLAWAAFIFPLAEKQGEEAYTGLFRERDLLQTLRSNPKEVSAQEFNDTVLKFLRKWAGRHIGDGLPVAEQFLHILTAEINNVRLLEAKKLEAVNIEQLKSPIEQLFMALSNISWQDSIGREVHLGNTFASKLAHILVPSLFVMWDNTISEEYQKKGAKTYMEFLRVMQENARSAVSDFRSLVGGEDIGDYLSGRLQCTTPKTTAKFIDEYNYLRFTKKILLPPPLFETDLVKDMLAWS